MPLVYEGLGNVFNAPQQTLVVTVNCIGVMGKGIALYAKKAVPGLYERYVGFCRGKQFGINSLMVYPHGDKKILLFPTKFDWRNPSKLEWIEANLIKLAGCYRERGITSIALPPLGCANGQLKWQDVRALIIEHLGDTDLEVAVYFGREYPET